MVIHKLHFFQQCNPSGFIPAIAFCCSHVCHFILALSCYAKWIHSLPAHQAVQFDVGLQPSSLDRFTASSLLQTPLKRIAHMYGKDTNSHKDLESSIETDEEENLCGCSASFNASVLETIISLEQVHLLGHCILDCGLETHTYCRNLLLDLYVEHESLPDAVRQFEQLAERDVFSWNIMIFGYVSCDCFLEALQFYERMYCAGFAPNETTYMYVLDACGHLGALKDGRLVHGVMTQDDTDTHPILFHALINMHAKCAAMEDALKIFHESPKSDVMSWSALMGGFAECGQVSEAFEWFKQMKDEGVQPNEMTYTYMLQACCHSEADLDAGRRFHIHIIKQGFDLVDIVHMSLLDMYVSCGRLEDAEHLFCRYPNHSATSWSILIAGFVQHGNSDAALRYFEQMKGLKIRPTDASFVGILCACSNAGMTHVGSMLFKSMMSEFDIFPAMEHCVCMVEILGRMGHLKEAEDLILQMPYVADAMIWVSLLGICNKYSNVEVGERAFRCFLRCESKIGAGYKLMASIYAANHMVERAEQVHKMLIC